MPDISRIWGLDTYASDVHSVGMPTDTVPATTTRKVRSLSQLGHSMGAPLSFTSHDLGSVAKWNELIMLKGDWTEAMYYALGVTGPDWGTR